MKTYTDILIILMSLLLFITIPAMGQNKHELSDEKQATEAIDSLQTENRKKGFELLLKAAKARGGVDKFKNIKTSHSSSIMTVHTSSDSRTVKNDYLEVLPDKFIYTMKLPEAEFVMVFNRDKGWMIKDGSFMMMNEMQISNSLETLARNSYLIFATMDNPKYNVSFDGMDVFNGSSVYRLDFETSNQLKFTWFLEEGSYLPIGRSYISEFLGKPDTVVEKYSDFKDFNGIKIETKAFIKAQRTTYDLELINLSINADYDSSVFVMPENK